MEVGGTRICTEQTFERTFAHGKEAGMTCNLCKLPSKLSLKVMVFCSFYINTRGILKITVPYDSQVANFDPYFAEDSILVAFVFF